MSIFFSISNPTSKGNLTIKVSCPWMTQTFRLSDDLG
jgi:hypothetical protein